MPYETSNSTSSPASKASRPAFAGRRLNGFIVVSLLLALLFFFGLRYLVTAFTHESTDDASIDTGIVAISPKVAGMVAAVVKSQTGDHGPKPAAFAALTLQ